MRKWRSGKQSENTYTSARPFRLLPGSLGLPRKRERCAKEVNMPYKSDAQRKWAHTKEGEKALGGKEKVKEWDQASKGKKLPEHSTKPKSK